MHRGRRPRGITPSKYFQTLKGESELFFFLLSKNNTTSSPRILGQQFNNLLRAALLTSSVQYDKILSKFGQQKKVMANMCVVLTNKKRGNILNES